jgi:hypothetical protein
VNSSPLSERGCVIYYLLPPRGRKGDFVNSITTMLRATLLFPQNLMAAGKLGAAKMRGVGGNSHKTGTVYVPQGLRF